MSYVDKMDKVDKMYKTVKTEIMGEKRRLDEDEE